MKKILITGANSYIGTSFEKYINDNFAKEYKIETVDMIGDAWKEKSFADYDVVFHVAGIAHQKETPENYRTYYDVNRNLSFEVATKAKEDGVKQFIFLSTMSVYGMSSGVITRDTPTNPKSNYAKSKFQAENLIENLRDDGFKVCILRPPMVYGEGCKGNYQELIKIVKRFPIFPRISNKKSLIHVDNLSGFVKKAIDQDFDGLFFPQDEKYVRTIDLVKDIAKRENKKIYFSFILGFVVFILRPFVGKLRKAFGTLIYKI